MWEWMENTWLLQRFSAFVRYNCIGIHVVISLSFISRKEICTCRFISVKKYTKLNIYYYLGVFKEPLAKKMLFVWKLMYFIYAVKYFPSNVIKLIITKNNISLDYLIFHYYKQYFIEFHFLFPFCYSFCKFLYLPGDIPIIGVHR